MLFHTDEVFFRQGNRYHWTFTRDLLARLEEHIPGASEHAQRVSKTATELSVAINIPFSLMRSISVGGLLHDIGKLHVSLLVVRQPPPWTAIYTKEMRKHVEYGADIISRSGFHQDVLDAVHYHHECWGGGGYPEGLSGEDIPLIARIISVADVWDALISERSYKAKLTQDQALAEMTALAGGRFEPALVEQFVKMIRGGIMTAEIVIPVFVIAWLSACSWSDWKKRLVSNWLTMPVILVFLLLRIAKIAYGPWEFAFGISIIVLIGWFAGVGIGGADAKITIAMALIDPQLAIWAWLGVIAWYLAVRAITLGEKGPYNLPGVVGFLLGAVILFGWRLKL